MIFSYPKLKYKPVAGHDFACLLNRQQYKN